MPKSTITDSSWTPLTRLNDALSSAVDQALSLNDEARKLARRTLKTVRSRSETVLEAAQQRSDSTYKAVRERIVTAGEVVDQRRERLVELVDEARGQLGTLENSLLRGVETIAHHLNLATVRDVEALRKKLSSLERKLEQSGGARNSHHAG